MKTRSTSAPRSLKAHNCKMAYSVYTRALKSSTLLTLVGIRGSTCYAPCLRSCYSDRQFRLLIAEYTRLSCTKQGKFEHCKYNRETWRTKARPQNIIILQFTVMQSIYISSLRYFLLNKVLPNCQLTVSNVSVVRVREMPLVPVK